MNPARLDRTALTPRIGAKTTELIDSREATDIIGERHVSGTLNESSDSQV
jgi:hypothetical protein